MVHKHSQVVAAGDAALAAAPSVHTHALALNPLLKRPQVCQLTTLSDAALTAAVAAKTFPAPVRTGIRAVAWRSSDVARWLENPVPLPSKARPERHRDSMVEAQA